MAGVAKVMGQALVRVSRVGRASVGRAALELGALHDQLAIMPVRRILALTCFSQAAFDSDWLVDAGV